jgi:hypothetical protein
LSYGPNKSENIDFVTVHNLSPNDLGGRVGVDMNRPTPVSNDDGLFSGLALSGLPDSNDHLGFCIFHLLLVFKENNLLPPLLLVQ